MTDREAICQLEIFLIGLMGVLGDEKISSCKITLAEKMSDAVRQAQSALQEREERSKYREDLDDLLTGHWVETENVKKALGITFAQGMRMFDFSRTAEWWSIAGKTDEERARNGQKITTCFRLKGAEK